MAARQLVVWHDAGVRITGWRRVAASFVAVIALASCGKGGSEAPPTNSTGAITTTSPVPTASDGLAPATATTSLDTITVDELPPQAVKTLALIRAGGPFPYKQDGVSFQNRERILPKQPGGFYQEYTVKKPGSSDRGPWRLVTGKDGSVFWTSDHYSSFEEVVQP